MVVALVLPSPCLIIGHTMIGRELLEVAWLASASQSPWLLRWRSDWPTKPRAGPRFSPQISSTVDGA